MMEKKIMVVGAGLMGSGIAQVFALAGIQVVLNDRTEEDLTRGKNFIAKSIQSLLKREKYNMKDEQRIHSSIQYSTNLQDGKNVDLVIEAVPERIELKQQVFKQLDQIVQPNAILASNTSSLSIAAIGSVTNRPDKVIGMHFFSPVPIMKLLEIITSIETSGETWNV